MMPTFKLGEPVDESQLEKKPPPVVIEAQPDSFIRLETPEEVQAWEVAVRQTTGLDFTGNDMSVVRTEGCSNGCSDKSDVCRPE
ncbi:hypothetical protein [Streptomyces bicolor]|uniref:hypothetical protein n=1 Tax=Streptomyces bicolor TaxID=66874 RepID=UPI0004E25C8E|nr:hypothetical protein [Streptomyces bicolor]